MTTQESDPNAGLRWAVYGMLIAIAVGNMVGRIFAVNSVDQIRLEQVQIRDALAESRQHYEVEGLQGGELAARMARREREIRDGLRLQRPFLSSNDRSRWAAIRAMVEYGTFAIDDVVAQPGWDTIDMVQHEDRSGVPRLYSSKPPLLSILIAGEYWVIHRATGAALGTNPYEIGRFMLITINVTGMVFLLVIVARLAERFGRTDWGRIFVVASAALGTFLTTFAVVLNNHTIAAASAAVAVYLLARIWCDGELASWRFALCGLAAAFTAANELPALAFVAAAGVGLLWRYPKQAALAFLPSVAVVATAAIGANYLVHDSIRPPYTHRSLTDKSDNWYDFTYLQNGEVRESYWNHPSGIDQGEPSRGRYMFHVLIGHHGVFSLTPLWLLSAWGCWLWLAGERREPREAALLIGSVSLVCLAFYLMRGQHYRNYGGLTSCFRWMLWFAPMWLLLMLPAADRLSTSRAARGLALFLLAASALAASYPTWNPWTHPWITDWMLSLGWENFH